MDLKLTNTTFSHDGIFGTLTYGDDMLVCYTLQHAYDSGNGNGSYLPKVPNGVYKCVRGQHQLAHMTSPFTTFEITNVPGHTNILFHQGNKQDDSEGCVLLGNVLNLNKAMILNSHDAFLKFMSLQNNVNEFNLTVL